MEKPNLEIVQLSPDDWKAYRDLRLESLKDSPQAFSGTYEKESQYTESYWREKLEKSLFLKSRFLFAKINDEVVGFLAAVVGDTPKLEHVVIIDTLYVSPKVRGKGIARKLFEQLLKEIKQHPEIIKLQLTVTTDQDAAIKLYESLGFEIAGKYKKDLKLGNKYYDMQTMDLFLNQTGSNNL